MGYAAICSFNRQRTRCPLCTRVVNIVHYFLLHESAVSVQISPGRYLILGGHTCDPCQTLKSTELFEDGNFTPGPDLPEPMNRFSAAMFNDTHLFVGRYCEIYAAMLLSYTFLYC